jgi:hypothetical protein
VGGFLVSLFFQSTSQFLTQLEDLETLPYTLFWSSANMFIGPMYLFYQILNVGSELLYATTTAKPALPFELCE